MALLVYVFMFAAAIKLRYSRPNQPRAYKIPGGFFGIWLVAGTGLLCCIVTILIGFIPPTQIPFKNPLLFQGFLCGGLIIFVLIPWLLAKRNVSIH
jgi:amino acid transporter